MCKRAMRKLEIFAHFLLLTRRDNYQFYVFLQFLRFFFLLFPFIYRLNCPNMLSIMLHSILNIEFCEINSKETMYNINIFGKNEIFRYVLL